MPFEARKNMKYGPGRYPIQLVEGDEVPAPVKKSLLKKGRVAEVSMYSGRSWASQVAVRDAKEDAIINAMDPGSDRDKAIKSMARNFPLTPPLTRESNLVAGKPVAEPELPAAVEAPAPAIIDEDPTPAPVKRIIKPRTKKVLRRKG